MAGTTEMAAAWVYPEHRDIAVLAVQGLDPQRRALLDDLWRLARTGDEQTTLMAVRTYSAADTPLRMPQVDFARRSVTMVVATFVPSGIAARSTTKFGL